MIHSPWPAEAVDPGLVALGSAVALGPALALDPALDSADRPGEGVADREGLGDGAPI